MNLLTLLNKVGGLSYDELAETLLPKLDISVSRQTAYNRSRAKSEFFNNDQALKLKELIRAPEDDMQAMANDMRGAYELLQIIFDPAFVQSLEPLDTAELDFNNDDEPVDTSSGSLDEGLDDLGLDPEPEEPEELMLEETVDSVDVKLELELDLGIEEEPVGDETVDEELDLGVEDEPVDEELDLGVEDEPVDEELDLGVVDTTGDEFDDIFGDQSTLVVGTDQVIEDDGLDELGLG